MDQRIQVRECGQFEGCDMRDNDKVVVTDSGMGETPTKLWTGPDFGCVHYEETQEQLPQDHPGYAMQQIKLAAR